MYENSITSPSYGGNATIRAAPIIGTLIKIGVRLLPIILRFAKSQINNFKNKIRRNLLPVKPPIYNPFNAKQHVIDKILPEMQKAYETSIKTGMPFPGRAEWKNRIAEILNTITHNIPPELLDDYIDSFYDSMSDMLQ